MAVGLTIERPDKGEYEPVDVNGIGQNGFTVHVDTETGQIAVEQEDGSMKVTSGGGANKAAFDAAFDANLAEHVGETELASIAQQLLRGIDADDRARRDWVDTVNKGLDYLGIKLEDASSKVATDGGISRTHHTMLLESVMRSWANSRAELLPVSGPVKTRDDKTPMPQTPQQPQQPAPPAQGPGGGIGDNGGPPLDPTQAGIAMMMKGVQQPGSETRDMLSEALAKDMNHYLTVIDREYYPDTSHMLMHRALFGCEFKKVYYDPLLRRPVSRWVKGTDLIISNDCSHLMSAGRVTERITMRRATVMRMQAGGHWRKVDLVTTPPTMPTTTEQKVSEVGGVSATHEIPEDTPLTFYECYCELMIEPFDEDETGEKPGYPLPYRVTIEKDSQNIVEIRRNWKQGDEDHRARRRYVKFGFIPGFGYYDLGFIHILGNPQRACTAIERMLVDSGMFASFPGGVIAKGPGSKQDTTEIRMGPGQFKAIETGGLPIDQVFKANPYKEPSMVLMQVGQDIAAQGRRIASVLELPVGEGRIGDVPATTIMSYVDSISKVPSAVHKDDHIAQQDEYEMLRDLFREYPNTLVAGNRNPARKAWTEAELDDCDLVPASDPNTPSQMHRIMKITSITQAAELPIFQGIADPRAIWRLVCGGLDVDPTSVTLPPAPPGQAPPDPKLQAAQVKAQTEREKVQGEIIKEEKRGEIKHVELEARAANDAANRDSEDRRANLDLISDVVKSRAQENIRTAEVQHDQAGAHIDRVIDHHHQTEDRAQEDLHHQETLAHEAEQGDAERDASLAVAKEAAKAAKAKAVKKPAKPKKAK